MKNKIKASDLFVELMLASQVSMASEDEHITKRIAENHPYLGDDEKKLIKDISMNNEFMRIAMIKTTIMALIKYGVVEEDVDILNINNSNQLVSKAIEIFEKNKQN